MRVTWCLRFAGLLLGAATLGSAETSEFQVVVHPGVQGGRISRANLAALFTGRTDRFGDQTKAHPVDQSGKAPVRRAFTASVIGLSLGELQMLWQRRIAAERVFPPPVKGSDDEVLGYVAGHAGAIGYVSAGTAIPDGVRVIAVVD